MTRAFLSVLVLLLLVPLFLPTPAPADLPGRTIGIWNIQSGGIWRREVRTRELARWYRHYEWRSDQRLWLKRRAEGVWVYGASLSSFTCRAHCILQNPNGPGVWRIWRLFRRADVRRFRMHYRVYWAGHANQFLAEQFPDPLDPNPVNQQFVLAMDHLEIVTPKEPADPDPSTPGINENVEIMDENGVLHFLGEPGFEIMPDTQANPNGFTLATTAQSELLLPPPNQRIQDPPFPPQPGHVEIAPGVVVEWLMDDFGNVLVDEDGIPGPDDPLSPTVLGGQKHQGRILDPTGIDGNEAQIQHTNTDPQLYCWELDENGEVLGSLPGNPVVGPPVDLNGDGQADNAVGAPIPMDPTVRDEFDQRDPTARPWEMVVVEEDEPTPAELDELNQRLAEAGIPPVSGPFKLCIRQIRVRQAWGIDRRTVMDTWFHHWQWLVSHHFVVQTGLHRVWLTRAALTAFLSQHHHYEFGQPPTWTSLFLAHVRWFRVCYRIYCPRPGVVRVGIDQLWMTVPVDPDDPESPLMMVSTENNENLLPSPGVRAGLEPDPLPVNALGVRVDEIDPILDGLDLVGGGTGQFDGDLSPIADGTGTMAEIAVVGNQDFPNRLDNNQLQLYCWPLNKDGTLTVSNIGSSGKDGAPGLDEHLGVPSISFTEGPTPAIPVFEDDMGGVMPDPTMLSLEMMDTDITGVPTPTVSRLLQNFPNPVAATTNIPFEIQAADEAGTAVPVQLRIYDLQGREVATVIDQALDPGPYTALVGESVVSRMSAGIYFYRLQVGDETFTRKMVVTRD